MESVAGSDYTHLTDSHFLNSFTVFIRLSAQGAYLIFGLSGWALIRGWALIKFSPFSVSKKFILKQNNK